MGFLSDITGTTGARLAGAAREAIQRGEDLGIGALNNAYSNARDYATRARQDYQPVVDRGTSYGQADPVLLSALGIGDPNIARQAFRTDPGYDFAVNQGLDAVQRRQNSLGMNASGNTWAELQRTGQGLADQQYQTWLGNVRGVSQMGLQAATAGAQGQGGADLGLAGLSQSYGQNVANLLSGSAQNQATQYGNEASARSSGAANIAGLGMNIARLAAGAGGYYGGYA